jgi:hypothetical protein
MAIVELLIVLLFAGGVAMVILMLVAGRRGAGERRQRLRLVATNLRQGALDDPTRQRLVTELLGGAERRRHRHSEARRRGSDRLAFVAGWVIFTVGVGLLVTGVRDVVEGGVFLTIFGLGVVGLPPVLREYDERIARPHS